jgi:uncharacterized membrane-anchored protein YhcB (DUF1043 family)
MSILWKSPFNKVVRSSEAGLAGVLIGLLVGMLVTFYTPRQVTHSEITAAMLKCKTVENIGEIKVGHHDILVSVTCII